MESFSWFLGELLDQRGLSQSDFAKLTETPHQTVSSVLGDIRKPPKQQAVLERWAKALELDNEQRKRFLYLADLARAPHSVRLRLDLLMAENDRLKRQLGDGRPRAEKRREP